MREAYTMRPRTLDVIKTNETNRFTPGPAAYDSIDLEPKEGRFQYAQLSYCILRQ